MPAEWLDRHDASQTGSGSVVDGFDVTFHLFGEQRMPSLLGIRQFASKKHVFVNSKEYPASCVESFLDGNPFEELAVSPWDARSVHDSIIHHAKPLPANTRIGINLTGGTKMMFTGALSAARALALSRSILTAAIIADLCRQSFPGSYQADRFNRRLPDPERERIEGIGKGFANRDAGRSPSPDRHVVEKSYEDRALLQEVARV